ncbi:MAG: ABC transporter substrate-binding protein [Beijerinckiaceae bacterium]|nr:ABC transporter substrate-binding protein [Beijerinckiaceae bacterium]
MRKITLALAGATIIAAAGAASAQDKIKIAIPQQGLWETGMVEIGAALGIFKKEGIEIEPLYTRGGAETVQAVLSGSVDIAASNGLLGTIGAFSKGAPIRVTAASMTGSPELFWYAKTESNIKSIKDLEGKSMGFSAPGSSTHLVGQALLDLFKVKAKLVPSGTPSGSFTMTMSGQIDAGWSVPPFRLQEIEEGKVNVVVRGNQVPEMADQTIRVYVSTAQTIKSKRDQLVRFHRALANSVAFAYSNDQALEIYAKMANITPAIARRVRDEYHPLPNMQLKEVRKLDLSLQQALEFKFIDKAMKPDDLKPMIDILVP